MCCLKELLSGKINRKRKQTETERKDEYFPSTKEIKMKKSWFTQHRDNNTDNNNNNNNNNNKKKKKKKKKNLRKESESLLIAAQNNATRTNYVKAKIDEKQTNSKCRLCREIDETINYIVSTSRKLTWKEFMTKKGVPQRNMQKTHAQTRIYPWKWNALNSLRFWDIIGSPNLSQKTRFCRN